MPPRDLPAEVATVMAALRLTLSPGDAQALADLRERAGRMDATDGESPARRAFRLAAQVCGADPSAVHVAGLATALTAFNRAELLPLAPPREDRRQRGGWRTWRGHSGASRSVPVDPDDLNIDL